LSPVFRHGSLRLYLLRLLDEEPRHGYEVIRLLRDRFMGVYSPSPGTIYPRLARLEEEGLVTHDEVDGRKVYRITEAGREELRSRSDELDELEEELSASVSDIVREVREDVRETVRSLREELTWAARESRRASRDMCADLREQARQARDEAREQARQARDEAREQSRQAHQEAKEQAKQAYQEAKEQARLAREQSWSPYEDPWEQATDEGQAGSAGSARKPSGFTGSPRHRVRERPGTGSARRRARGSMRASRTGRDGSLVQAGRTGPAVVAGKSGRGCAGVAAGPGRSTSGRSGTWSGWPCSSPRT